MSVRILLLCLPLLLQACGSIPDSPDELVRTSTTTATFCYQDQLPIVKSRVRDFLTRCYGPVRATTMIPINGSLVPMSMRLDFSVLEDEHPGGARLSVKNMAGVGYVVDMDDKTVGCTTRLNMYAVTGLWQRVFEKVDKVARGGEATCPH